MAEPPDAHEAPGTGGTDPCARATRCDSKSMGSPTRPTAPWHSATA